MEKTNLRQSSSIFAPDHYRWFMKQETCVTLS
jgi:hypothetical protein